MEYKVTDKQPILKMCFVCGEENRFGLKSNFFELENDELCAIFAPINEHQGYPGRLHGGIAAAILDETIGRAIMIHFSHNIWGVTVDFSMRFKKPVPLNEEIKVIGRVEEQNKRFFQGSGEILLPDGTVCVTAKGKYMKLDIENITDEDFTNESWHVVTDERDPALISY